MHVFANPVKYSQAIDCDALDVDSISPRLVFKMGAYNRNTDKQLTR